MYTNELTSFQSPMHGWYAICLYMTKQDNDSRHTDVPRVGPLRLHPRRRLVQGSGLAAAQGTFQQYHHAMLLMLDTLLERRSVPSAKARSGPTLQRLYARRQPMQLA